MVKVSPPASAPLDILLPTIGSAGDVHPVIALGKALAQRGHRATVITNPLFEQQVRESGLGFVALGTLQEAEEAIADPRLWHPTRSFDCVVERAILPNIERLYSILAERQNANTVVAASGMCLGARLAQEKLGIPMASVHLQPVLLRSLMDSGRQGRIPMGPGVPRFLKRSLFWSMDKFWIDRRMAPPLNSFRGRLGLAPVTHLFRDYIHSPQLVIGFFPEWYAAVQPDWPVNTHLAGFVLHDDSERQTVNAEVEEFLAAGPPPLVFTPGSAAATLKDFFRESVSACRMGGHRAMLVTNFPEQIRSDLPSHVRSFSYVPFSRILPRCAALIYPGGIGTMAQAIKAGIPHLVVPHGHDQPDNALRMQRLSLGLSVYPERFKAARITRMLHALLTQKSIRARCAEYAEKINSNAALHRACDLIEGLAVARRGVARP